MVQQYDLRNQADIDYYFGEIKLWYDAKRKPVVNAGVIVEAKSDEKLFRKLLHQDTTFFAVDGWLKCVAILKMCETHNVLGILSIIDADFKRILGYENNSKSLYLTDFHDKEIMIAHSQAWLDLLNSFGEPQKIKALEAKINDNVLNFLLTKAHPIGLFRLLEERLKLGLKFKVKLDNNKFKFIDYEKFINDKNLTIDEAALLKTIEDKSQKQGLFKNNPNLGKELEVLKKMDIDLKELCNGHDLMSILAIALMNLIGNRKSSTKVSSEELEEGLILAYRLADFDRTMLFQSLLKWEENNSPLQLQRITTPSV